MSSEDLLKEIKKAGLLDEAVVNKLQRESLLSGKSVESLVANQRLVPDEKVAEIKSSVLKIPYKKINTEAVGADTLQLIPEETARVSMVAAI